MVLDTVSLVAELYWNMCMKGMIWNFGNSQNNLAGYVLCLKVLYITIIQMYFYISTENGSSTSSSPQSVIMTSVTGRSFGPV